MASKPKPTITAKKIAKAKAEAKSSNTPVTKVVVTNSRGSKAVDVAVKSGIAKLDKTYKAPKEGPLKESQRATATKSEWAAAKVSAKTKENPKLIASRISTDKSKTAMRAKMIESRIKDKANPKRKYTKSEQDFLDGQKLKKKILKKTGVYPNTAT